MSFPRKDYQDEQPGKSFTPSEAKEKILAYCNYQERCQKEVRQKLYDYGIPSKEVEKLITFLILEGYLNEERFAKAFARGKFRLRRWGKWRIQKELQTRGLNDTCIKSGMKEIDEKEYWDTLLFLAEKKWVQIKDKDPYVRKMKLNQFLNYKGFESTLVHSILDKFTENP